MPPEALASIGFMYYNVCFTPRLLTYISAFQATLDLNGFDMNWHEFTYCGGCAPKLLQDNSSPGLPQQNGPCAKEANLGVCAQCPNESPSLALTFETSHLNIQKYPKTHTKKHWFLDSCDSLGAKRPAAQSLWKCILLTPRFCRTLKKTALTPAEILYSVPSSQCRTPSSSTHLVHLRAANQLGARDIHPQNSQILMEMNGTCPCPTNLQPCWNQYFGRMRWAMLSMYEINKA